MAVQIGLADSEMDGRGPVFTKGLLESIGSRFDLLAQSESTQNAVSLVTSMKCVS